MGDLSVVLHLIIYSFNHLFVSIWAYEYLFHALGCSLMLFCYSVVQIIPLLAILQLISLSLWHTLISVNVWVCVYVWGCEWVCVFITSFLFAAACTPGSSHTSCGPVLDHLFSQGALLPFMTQGYYKPRSVCLVCSLLLGHPCF